EDGRVLAPRVRPRDGNAAAGQRGDHAVLPLHGMGGRQQLAGRLPAQHVLPGSCTQVVGRVRLATAELANGERACKSLDVVGHVARESMFVDAMGRKDLRRFRPRGIAHEAALSPGTTPPAGGGSTRANRFPILAGPALSKRVERRPTWPCPSSASSPASVSAPLSSTARRSTSPARWLPIRRRT